MLTDAEHTSTGYADLVAACRATRIPVLQRDWMLHPMQARARASEGPVLRASNAPCPMSDWCVLPMLGGEIKGGRARGPPGTGGIPRVRGTRRCCGGCRAGGGREGGRRGGSAGHNRASQRPRRARPVRRPTHCSAHTVHDSHLMDRNALELLAMMAEAALSWDIWLQVQLCGSHWP